MSQISQIVELRFEEVKHETHSAYLILFDRSGVQAWLPKSQCEVSDGDKIVQMPQWLVEEKGLDAYVD